MAEALTFKSMTGSLRKGDAPAVTLLYGEEGYYIDALVKEFEALVPEADRDFDLTTLYAPELDSPMTAINACRSYSMFGGRKVVILKEAQNVQATFLKALVPYVSAPADTTAFCICVRGKREVPADLVKAVKAGGGWVFESKRLTESTIANAVSGLIADSGLSVDPKALAMLCEYVGTDLSRLYNEVGKLTVSLGPGAMITPEAVEANIGISKDYNPFELVKAIANHQTLKVMKIYRYMRGNPKANPLPMITPSIFRYFANLLAVYYLPDRSPHGIAAGLGFKSQWQANDYISGLRYYKPWDVIEIIGLIRRFDCNSKGNGSRQDPYDLFLDLLLHILNPMGQKGVKL